MANKAAMSAGVYAVMAAFVVQILLILANFTGQTKQVTDYIPVFLGLAGLIVIIYGAIGGKK